MSKLIIDRERLAGAVRIARKDAEMTGAQFARAVGCNEATIYRIEAGRHDPRAQVLLRILEHLGRKLQDFARVETGDATEGSER